MLRLLVKLYTAPGAATDRVAVCHCLFLLDDAPAVAAMLEALIAGSEVRGRRLFVCLYTALSRAARRRTR